MGVIKRIPVLKISNERRAVTLERVVEKIQKGIFVEYHQDLLYKLTIKLFFAALNRPENMMYLKYRKYEEILELAHEAYCLFLAQLNEYDPKKSKVSTWIYTLVKIMVGRIKRKIYKDTKFKNVENYDRTNLAKNINMMKEIDFKDSVIKLLDKFPCEYKIINELFGNPYEENYQIPDCTENYKKISKRLDIKYSSLRRFIQEKAKGIFRRYYEWEIL